MTTPRDKYENPIPVAVCMIPLMIECEKALPEERYLGIIRAIPPALGTVVLPGGFVDKMEDLSTAAARECKEETGLIIPDDEWMPVASRITPNNQLLVFMMCTPRLADEVMPLVRPGPETAGFKIIDKDTELGFPLHQEVVREALS